MRAGTSALHSKFRTVFGFHHQDARHGLQAIAQRALNDPEWPGLSTTITSPPYYKLKDYEADRQIGHEKTYEKYLDTLTGIFKLVYSLTSESGSFWLVCNTFMVDSEVVPLPFDLARRMKDVGWKLKDIVIWQKDKNLPWSTAGLRNVFEYVLLFAKNNLELRTDAVRDSDPDNFRSWWVKYPERYSPKGVAPTDVWKIGIPVQGSWRHNKLNHYHLCPFPVELVRRMLLLTTDPDDIVLDPFAGSGIVLATAECMGRMSTGFEVQRKYVRNFYKTIRREVRSELRQIDAKETANFESNIRKLRLIKLPRMLVRSMGKYAMSNTRFAVAVERPLSPKAPGYKITAEDIHLIVGSESSKRSRRLMETKARKQLSKPPLSKYGIETLVKVVTLRELRSILKGESRTMWIYSKRNISYDRKIAVTDMFSEQNWLQREKKLSYPVIVSTIRLREPAQKLAVSET